MKDERFPTYESPEYGPKSPSKPDRGTVVGTGGGTVGRDTLEDKEQVKRKGIDRRIELALRSSIPSSLAQYVSGLCALVRQLKNIPYLSGALPDNLDGILREWGRRSKFQGKDLVLVTIIRADFVKMWSAYNRDEADLMVRAALQSGQARRPGDPIEVLCRELQRQASIAGSEFFFLGCRTAGRVLGISKSAAHRKMIRLSALGIIAPRKDKKGSIENGLATEWKYLYPLE